MTGVSIRLAGRQREEAEPNVSMITSSIGCSLRKRRVQRPIAAGDRPL